MKSSRVVLIAILLSVVAGCVAQPGMNPHQRLDKQGVQKYPFIVGLFIPKEFREYVYREKTSPFLNLYITYPVGEQSALLFHNNLPPLFIGVQDMNSPSLPLDVKLVLQPSLVSFDLNATNNPYTATVVYRIDVFNRRGEKIYTQTATGKAEITKNVLSDLRPEVISAEVAPMAMNDAMQKLLEGLAAAKELRRFR